MSSVRNGIYGLCVADALGVPAESRTRADLEQNPITEMVGGGIHGQPSGYWSDDSSMTLCLADSIGQVGYYHTHDIMARFDDWCCNGPTAQAENGLTLAIPALGPSTATGRA